MSGGRYTLLLQTEKYQTSPNSRKNLQKARLGINADAAGIKDLILSIGPSQSAAIPANTVYFGMISSDVLQVTITSIDPVNSTGQTTVLNVNRVLEIASPLTGVTITNLSTVNVVECQVIYS